MAFSVVQNQISASPAATATTTSLTWSPAPANGHLLVVTLVFRINGTTSENTTQGWIKAVTKADGTLGQTEIWYRVAGAGEGTTGPAFNLPASALYQIAQAEVSGFTGTPTLDQTGVNQGSGVNTLTTTVSATITAGSEFVYGGAQNREGNTAGVTWSTSTSSPTGVVDIAHVNQGKNAEGINHAWNTSGASGTSPSITSNISSTSNTDLITCIATFQGVVAAAVAGLVSSPPFSEG